ncbi:MAG: 2-amino-4-hydroxy-6-hydroxymethyldihydropteridine diphosphokinase [Candidatus Krumholzibacteriota bacterium]|nr:2-amino-4-hydroxy-6-hydroxymethyldihydropteridine diphosphokinase [Candidatus Krumholzibacteriota bacterium]
MPLLSNEKLNSAVHIVTLSLGSNLGERESNIIGAVKAMNDLDNFSLKRLSSLYETEPAGSGFSGTFINSAAVFEADIAPYELLSLCKKLEKRFGRKEGLDRPLDIDIILYGEILINKPDLKIPHKMFRQRSFVLEPMLEICPYFKVPPDNMTVSDIAERMPSSGWVRKVSSRSFINTSSQLLDS